MNNSRAAPWYSYWQKTGKLPDGRRAYAIHLGIGSEGPHACFEPEVEQRRKAGLPVPWPNDPPTRDGYKPLWEPIDPH